MSDGAREAYALLFDAGASFAHDASAFEQARERVGVSLGALSVIGVVLWLATGPVVHLAVSVALFVAVLACYRVISRLGEFSWRRREVAFDCFLAATALLAGRGGEGAPAPEEELPDFAARMIDGYRRREFGGERLLRLVGGGSLRISGPDREVRR